MAHDDDAVEVKTLVRAYSYEVEERISRESEAHVLAHALTELYEDRKKLTAPWRKFFEPEDSLVNKRSDPITKVLEIESANLREKWLAFQQDCPKEERLDLQKYEPTIEGVTEMMADITAGWRSKRHKGKFGKIMKVFDKFTHTLQSHRTFLECLPEGSEYVSLFTGCVNAILKASANHERIAEGFSDSICLISLHIEEARGDLALFSTPEMKALIADLYEHIFLFLNSVMSWIMEKRYKRLLDSFKEDFKDRFDKEIKKICLKVDAIRNKANQSSHAETRVVRLMVEDLERDMRLGLEGEERHRAEMRYFAERIERQLADAENDRKLGKQQIQLLGRSVKLLLERNAKTWIDGNRTSAPDNIAWLNMVAHPLAVAPPLRECASEDIITSSKNLEDYFHRDRVRLSIDEQSPVLAYPEMISRIGEWTEGKESTLWLDGPANDYEDVENPLSVLASRYIELAAGSRVPVVSYFCELRRGEALREGNATLEIQGTIALLYALLRQMIELLLPEFETTADLSAARFQRLDGTESSWKDALAMFRDLLEQMPDTVFCIIDGLHWLDDRSSQPALKELVVQLRDGGKLKNLFTTSGRSSCLGEEIPNYETFVLDNLDTVAFAYEVDEHKFVAGSSVK